MDHIKGAIHGEKAGQQPQAAPAPQQPAAAPPAQEEHHHGKDFVKKIGNAATFGAGATLGADAVNSVFN